MMAERRTNHFSEIDVASTDVLIPISDVPIGWLWFCPARHYFARFLARSYSPALIRVVRNLASIVSTHLYQKEKKSLGNIQDNT